MINTKIHNIDIEYISNIQEVRDIFFNANSKIYKTPSGNNVKYEGDENLYLDYLYNNLDERNIIIQPDIVIKYLDNNLNIRYWNPDIQINKNNLKYFIKLKELKYLINCEFDINCKIYSTRLQGYGSHVIIYHKKELYKLNLINFKNNLWELSEITDGLSLDYIKELLINGKVEFNIVVKRRNNNGHI